MTINYTVIHPPKHCVTMSFAYVVFFVVVFFSLLLLARFGLSLFVICNCEMRFVRLKFKNSSIEIKQSEKKTIIKCLNCWQCEFVHWIVCGSGKKTDNTQYGMGIFGTVKLRSFNYKLGQDDLLAPWQHTRSVIAVLKIQHFNCHLFCSLTSKHPHFWYETIFHSAGDAIKVRSIYEILEFWTISMFNSLKFTWQWFWQYQITAKWQCMYQFRWKR